ncbi:hypothetical protein ACFYPX_29710 [Micromonospora zamorensis]|uniref:hypothetical protein n=1 Tax=Micromonospora zamorensis TaxID=709883 RepID=UPI0036BEEEC4
MQRGPGDRESSRGGGRNADPVTKKPSLGGGRNADPVIKKPSPGGGRNADPVTKSRCTAVGAARTWRPKALSTMPSRTGRRDLVGVPGQPDPRRDQA